MPEAEPLQIPEPRATMITSGEEEESSSEDETAGPGRLAADHPDELFDENADEEDEAYVYRTLRSGTFERVQVRDQQQRNQTLSVLKPRNSDAVLSCPCCFNIVCMDCQRHERYAHQFRAMFVMGIQVQWDQRWRYDDDVGGLVAVTSEASTPTRVVHEETTTTTTQAHDDAAGQVIYYTVCCANCHTQVAALDMTQEVYHFSDCLESN